MSSLDRITWIIFSQHGMADHSRAMESLARDVAPPQSYIVAPNLGFVQTLFAIEPLIYEVEQIASQVLEKHPKIPARIIATSLGGIIWIEVLSRNPEWWQRVESLILLGSPVGGADLARIIDPLSWGVGMAKHLAQSRRVIAEQITARVPTLVIAGDTTGGGDGTVSVESTKLKYAYFTCLDGVSHPELRTHPQVIQVIRKFWSIPREPLPAPEENLISRLIDHFRSVPGITDASYRGFTDSEATFIFADGTSIRTWKNLVGVNHIFIASRDGKCEYAAFVGWLHSTDLQVAIDMAIHAFSA